MSIPEHQRRNYDRTTDLTNQVKRLIGAAYAAADTLNTTPEQLAQADTMFALLNIAEEKVAALEHAQRLEWVGLGGNDERLTDAELKLARGE